MSEPGDIGRRLRHAREDQGLSQSALAQGICAPSSISRWEAGFGEPDEATVDRLAARLGISSETLSGRGFDAHIAESISSLDSLLPVACPVEDFHKPLIDSTHTTASWISISRTTMLLLDPWRTYPASQDRSHQNRSVSADPATELSADLESAVDQLARDHIGLVVPGAAQIVEILTRMLPLQQGVDARGLEELVDITAEARQAPHWYRLLAAEVAICGFALAQHSHAARSAAAKLLGSGGLTSLSYTTDSVLHAIEPKNLPSYRVRQQLSARDIAVLQLRVGASLPPGHHAFAHLNEPNTALRDDLPAELAAARLLT